MTHTILATVLPACLLACLAACTPSPTSTNPTSASVCPSGQTCASAPTESSPSTSTTPPPEHRWIAKKGNVVINVSDRPGPIVDSNAPPPANGQAVLNNPYFSASCAGDIVGCSQAGLLVPGAHSAQEFLDALKKNGYDVAPQ